MQSEYTIIGIDGGGSRTRGIIYQNGEIMSEAETGTTRIGAVGVGESCERILNIIAELCDKTKIDPSDIDIAVIGLAGAWLIEEQQRSAQVLKTLARQSGFTLNDIFVTSDAAIALEGAFSGDSGVILIGGTGTIALGKMPKSEELVRCGGWGFELDDEGGGAWIGREALTAVVRAIDGRGQQTKFLDILAKEYPVIDLKRPRTIVAAYGERMFEYHTLTPWVMKCAEEGDEVCMRIIEEAAFHLMELLEAIVKHYEKTPVKVACMGGMLERETLLSRQLDKLIAKNKSFKRVKPNGNALDGAIELGKKIMVFEE